MPSRRTFVKGLAARRRRRQPRPAAPARRAPSPAPRSDAGVLTGTEFDLRIGETPVNFTGAAATALTINGSLPAPLLRWREGDTVTLRVANTPRRGHVDPLARHHPAGQHGRRARPQLRRHPPGETYTYRFTVQQAGTYWYHSHSGFQEQRGVYGPLVIEPREPRAVRATTASTWCCCRTGPTRIPSASSRS